MQAQPSRGADRDEALVAAAGLKSDRELWNNALIAFMRNDAATLDRMLTGEKEYLATVQFGPEGGTMLAMIQENTTLEIVDVLVRHGADIRDVHRHGYSALRQAAIANNRTLTLKFLDLGLDVNARSFQDETIIMALTARGRPEMVRLFIERGADINAMSSQGKTALCFVGTLAPEGLGGIVACIEILCAAGANPNGIDGRGNALKWATSTHQMITRPIFEALLRCGADPTEVMAARNPSNMMMRTIEHMGGLEGVRRAHIAWLESLPLESPARQAWLHSLPLDDPRRAVLRGRNVKAAR